MKGKKCNTCSNYVRTIAVFVLVLLSFVVISNMKTSQAIKATVGKKITTVIFEPTSGTAKTRPYSELLTTRGNQWQTFCIAGGDALNYNWYEYNEENLYNLNSTTCLRYFQSEADWKRVMWLADNIYYEFAGMDENLKLLMKENLKSQLNETGKTALDNLISNPKLLIAAQNCAIWRYTKNNIYAYNFDYRQAYIEQNSNANDFINALVDAANAHDDYVHTNSNITITPFSNFTINISNKKAGPYTVEGDSNLSIDKIVIYVNDQEVNGCTLSNENGGVYITLPNSNNYLNTNPGSTNIIRIAYKEIKTTAYTLYRSSLINYATPQRLLTINKELIQSEVPASSQVPILDLALVKTITNVYNTATENEINYNRFSPTTDVQTENLNLGKLDAIYNVDKTPVKVQAQDTVTYTFYVFNEGNIDAKVTGIKDWIPADYLELSDEDWEYVKENGSYKTKIIGAETYYQIQTTNFTSKTLSAYRENSNNKISYDRVTVKLKVKEPDTYEKIIRNYAEIMVQAAIGRNDITDRDSTPNNLSADITGYNDDIESAYIDNWNLEKGKYNQEDDDDFEQIIVEKRKIDLSLRKYISKVTRETEEVDIGNSRKPDLFGLGIPDDEVGANVLSYYVEKSNYSAGFRLSDFIYCHPKDTVEVRKGDIVYYTIRVYNEGIPGYYDGCATEITDTIPEGLSFNIEKSLEANGIRQGEDNPFEESNDVLTISLPKTRLTNILEYYTAKIANIQENYYQEIIVAFNVDEDASNTEPMINVAQITKYLYYKDKNDQNGTNVLTFEQSRNTDIDSTIGPNNWNWGDDSNPNDNEELIDNAKMELQWIKKGWYEYLDKYYVEGYLEDDSDFESVIVEQDYLYRVKILKVDQDNNPLPGIKINCFNNAMDAMTTVTTNNKGNAYIVGEDNLVVIPETASANWIAIAEVQTPNGIVPLNGILFVQYVFNEEHTNIIDIKAYFVNITTLTQWWNNAPAQYNDGETCDDETVLSKFTEDNYLDLKRYYLDEVGNNMITDVDLDKSITLPIELKDGTIPNAIISYENNENEADVVEIKLPNKVVIATDNKIKIKKVDENNNAIRGVMFKVNEEYKITDEDGTIELDERIGYENAPDITTIEEIDANMNRKIIAPTDNIAYSKLEEAIKIYKLPEYNTTNKRNYISKVSFDNTYPVDGTITKGGTIKSLTKEVTLEDGNKVTLTLTVEWDANDVATISINIPNRKSVGEYSLKIKKVDFDNPEQAIPGITFNFKQAQNANELTNAEVQTTEPTNELGLTDVCISKVMTNLNIDYYEIEEINIDNNYLKLKNKPIIMVSKEVKDNKIKVADVCFYPVGRTGPSRELEVVLENNMKVKLVLDLNRRTNIITITIPNKKVEYDLSLEKFITGVTTKEDTREITDREPKFKVDPTKVNGDGYIYVPDFDDLKPVEVNPTDIVTYTLRIYNEGEADAYAAEVADDIPEGVEFVPYTEDETDTSINKQYRWVMYKVVTDEEIAALPEGTVVKELDGVVTGQETKFKKCIITTDVKEADYIVTDYLSKEQGEARMKNGDTENPNLLKAFEPVTEEKLENGPDYRDLKIQFKVTRVVKTKEDADKVIINYAQITKETDKSGEPIVDRDSTPNKWIEEEDDQDREKIKVNYFDLALVKWVSEAIIVEDGVERTEPGNKLEELQNQYDHRLIYAMYPDTIGEYTDLEPVVKVDIPKTKLNSTVVKFKYQIRVYNEGQIDGNAKVVTDYIPTGMKFVQEDNPLWQDIGDGKVITKQLEDTVLKAKGEPETVEIIYTWINSEHNLGLIVNMAEISEDYNDYGAPDIDSTPNNVTPGEDDIDDAAVLLSVRTGTGINTEYLILAASVVALITVGIIFIKKIIK